MAGKIRIIHLATTLNPGGVTTLIQNILPHFESRGYENMIVTTISKESHVPDSNIKNCPLYYCPRVWTFNFLPSYRIGRLIRHSGKFTFGLRLYLLFKKLRPHIVHSHVHGDSWLSQLIASRLVSARFIMTLHSPSSLYPGTWRARFLFAKLLKKGDQIIGDSPTLYRAYESFLRSTSLPPPKYLALTPGVPDRGPRDEKVRDQILDSLGIAKEAFVIGSVGRMVSAKRYKDLIEAMGPLLNQFPQVHLVLVGDGSEMPILRKQAADLEANRRIHFTGFRDDPQYWNNCFDIFVICSLFEGFGIATIEAMSRQIPMVGTDVPFTNQLIEPEKTGLLFPVKNVHSLRACLTRLIESEPLRKKMGANGRARYLEKFTVGACVDKHMSLYKKLLGPGR